MKRVIDPYFKDIPHFSSISKALIAHENKIVRKAVIDLSIPSVYLYHSEVIMEIGQHYMDLEGCAFCIDEENKNVIKFLLYYFNNCKLAEDVFPNKKYKLHKNIILAGEPGTGKTLLMQIFSDYLKIINSGVYFKNLSVTQMMNYYKINSHIDKFTFNEIDSKSREGSPFHICMNDIGIETQNQKHFGTSGQLVIDEFLFARYEVYQSQRMYYHITTNMSIDDFKKHFEGRLIDRFKSFNVIPLIGKSRRK